MVIITLGWDKIRPYLLRVSLTSLFFVRMINVLGFKIENVVY